jgi:photosystem II stability/assembly factor-like uncharacterized protein
MKKSFSPFVMRAAALIIASVILLGVIFTYRSSYSSAPTCNEMTDAQVAELRGVTLETMELLHTRRGLAAAEICEMPQSKLDRAILRANDPMPDHPGEALAFRKLQLQDENGYIPADGLVNAAEQMKAMQADQDQDLNASSAGIASGAWTWLGPGNIGGRIRSLVIHPTNTDMMWAGSVSGGIWKTTNGGAKWEIITDFMANMAVASLAIDPQNPDILYAGTGEGFYNGDGIQGAGIFKSIDGGVTWTQLASTNAPEWYYVNRLAISSTSNIILAATESGIWRSVDGGNSWIQSVFTRTLDINFSPTNINNAIASGGYGEVWYSTDQGVTWQLASGLPSWAGRVEVAYASNDPSIVYASVDVNGGEIWKSADGGQIYTRVNTGAYYLGSQGWYDNALWVDPTDASRLVVGGIDLWRSTNGGAKLTKISQWWSAPQSAHADNHMIIEHPNFDGVNNKEVYFGNDGGVYAANNIYTVAPTTGWKELNNNLGITQFYGAAGNPTTGEIIGGTQDNGTLFYKPGRGPEGWTTTYGGDGGWSAADPTNPKYFYGEYVYLALHRSSDRGASASPIDHGIEDSGKCANFIAPFILDPNNPDRMLAGGCRLWRSDNVKADVPSWISIKAYNSSHTPISAIAVAPGNSNIIWIGYNNGDVLKTTNGATSHPTWTKVSTNSPGLPFRYVTRITIDKHDSKKVYVTYGGFSADNIWRTADGGASWTDITSNLPDLPVRSLVIHPANSNWLYIGTELGIFTSEDGGGVWTLPHDGPTNTSVDELFWIKNSLIAATHGRGMFKAATSPLALIKNGGFNSYAGVSKIPVNWDASKFTAADGKFTKIKKEGVASVRITSAAGVAKTLTQTLALPGGLAGNNLTFSFWVKGADIPSTGTCQALVTLYNGSTLVTSQVLDCPTGAYEFQQVTLPFTAPAAYNRAVIKFIYSEDSGTVWFDAANLMK